jgi:tetratricopeptide (TPR) repeat protein
MDRLPTKNESSQAAKRPKTKRILNLRLVVETLIVASILGPAIYLWYAWQLKRTEAAMLERAEKLVEDKDDRAAAQYYFRFLKLRPDDANGQVLLAETFGRAAKGLREKDRAVQYYYQALGVASPDKQHDLRRSLAEALLELRRFAPAEEESRELLKQDPNDPQGWRLLAMAIYGQSRTSTMAKAGDVATVGETFQRARELNPGDVQLAIILAGIYRMEPQLLASEQQTLSDAERQALADRAVDDMVAANGQSAAAYLARHRYRLRYSLPNAEDDLATALKCGPDDLEVLLQAASQARRNAETAQRKRASAEGIQSLWTQAAKCYEHAIEVSPADEPAYLGLGDLYAEQGKPDRAIETWRRGLEKGNKESIELNSRLTDLLIARGQLDDAETTLGVLAQAIERIGPLVPPPAKVAMKRTNDLVHGKWLVRKGRHVEAIPLLRLVAAGQPSAGLEARQSLEAWQWLGIAYGAINQWDQSATAYEQAAAMEPKIARLRAQAAGAWAAAGRLDTAIACYKQSLAIDGAPETWLELARAEFQRQLRLSREERKWNSFDEALAQAKKADDRGPLVDTWRLNLIEADSTLVRGEDQGEKDRAMRDALVLLRAAEKEHPDSTDLLQALVPAYERLEQPADADRILDNLAKTKDQAGVACLLKARLLVDRKQYDAARKALTGGMDALPSEMRPALQRELLRIELRDGKFDQAREQLLKLHETEPTNLELVTQLADLALEAGNFTDVEQWEKELRKLEGPDGLSWQYHEARRLLAQATGPTDAKLTRASELQSHVQSQRPAWSKAYLLQGMLSESRGKFEQAAEAYQEAIRLGEQQPVAFERLISLLTQMDRIADADRYLQLSRDQIAGSETLSSLEIAVATKRGQFDRALDTAQRGVERRPQDPIAYLWLGQVLLAGDKTAEAETALKKAVELAPTDARALGGLFGFYVRTKQPDRARETLKAVVKNEKLDEAQRALILAQGYESLGDQEQAQANFRQAAKLAADDATAQLRLVDYLLRTGAGKDRSEPEQMLRGVLQRWPDSGSARRMLAELLMERGGEREWQEAIGLVQQTGADHTALDVDRRMQAMLLAQRGGKENLEKAQQIFEELVVDPKKAVDFDRQRLAQLYEIDGKAEPARQQHLKLVSRENPSAAHLASYVEMLLRHKLYDEAETWLKKLESLSPDDLDAAMLRARWLHATEHDEQIEPLVEALAERLSKKAGEDKQKTADIAVRVGSLYTAVAQHQAAERWYRQLLEISPERYEPLASALGQQGRMREAIELCQKAAQSDDSARPAMVLGVILVSGKPTDADFQLAESTLANAVAAHKDDVNLLSTLAGVRVVQQQIDEAVRLYRQVLTLKPTHVATLNNLATLLAEQPDKRQEAIEYINRAIGIVGPQAALLDTKGMALVFDGKPGEAVPLLQEAAAMPQADPRHQFHLAVAYDRAGEAEKARAAWTTARKGNLASLLLTPLDRQMLTELEKKFNP